VSVQLNHTIVLSQDKQKGAAFLSGVLGLPEPEPYGPFMTVEADNDVTLDYMETDGEIVPQHYAFLVSEHEFDQIFGRILGRGVEYWADPHHTRPSEINTNDGGRGIYFDDPDGHVLEILTVPYGGG
jgi:catechol 2,3-dioxygenase-like lactoylglutathione lyase family enzyme